LNSIVRESSSSEKKAEHVRIFQQIGGWAGILAPIVFTALVIIESLLRPGYSQIYGYISDLGVGPYSLIQNSNFVIFGCLSFLFALGFGKTLNSVSGKRARVVTALIITFGLGSIFAGVSLLFSAYFAHLLSTFIAFGAAMAAQFLSWRSLINSNGMKWGSYRLYSLISGLLSVILFFVFLYTITAFPYLSTTTYHGLAERMFVAVPLLWMIVSGVKILRAEL
jgi:hypothetical membrane protein